jgi:hypothetical protein
MKVSYFITSTTVYHLSILKQMATVSLSLRNSARQPCCYCGLKEIKNCSVAVFSNDVTFITYCGKYQLIS